MRLLTLLACLCFTALAYPAAAQTGPVQAALQAHADQIAKLSRRTIQQRLGADQSLLRGDAATPPGVDTAAKSPPARRRP